MPPKTQGQISRRAPEQTKVVTHRGFGGFAVGGFALGGFAVGGFAALWWVGGFAVLWWVGLPWVGLPWVGLLLCGGWAGLLICGRWAGLLLCGQIHNHMASLKEKTQVEITCDHYTLGFLLGIRC